MNELPTWRPGLQTQIHCSAPSFGKRHLVRALYALLLAFVVFRIRSLKVEASGCAGSASAQIMKRAIMDPSLLT
jgi:hypothetical protein